MRYTIEVTVPADTPQSEPYEQRIKIEVGTLTSCMVRFLPGCHNQVYITIQDAFFQLIPITPGSSLYGDNVTYEIPLNYELTSKPYELIIRGWSPGTNFEHTITVWFDLLEPTVLNQASIQDQIAHLLTEL